MKRILGIILLGALTTGAAVAGNTNIGIVDLQKIMQTAPEMKEIQLKLEKQFKSRRDDLISQEDVMKKEIEKFKRDSTVMSQSQKQELEKKIMTMQQKFEREGQQYQKDLNAAHNQAMEKFYGKIRGVITKIAESEHYDLVLQKDAAPFSSDKLDITARVLREVDKS